MHHVAMRFGLLATLAACHLVERNEIVRPGTSERTVLRDRPTAKRPTILLTDAGTLRFVEPLECPTENIVQQTAGTEIVTKPNLATFVVGIVATSVGAIATIRGASDSDPAGSPFTYAGVALVGAGMPFAIGPWLGNGTAVVEGAPRPPIRTAGPAEPCGERAVSARTATLRVRGIEIHGSIDDGVFAVSPYAIVDAFELANVPTWDVVAVLDNDRTKQLAAMIDGGALATRAKSFLATAKFETRIEPMRLVPGLAAGTLRVNLIATPDTAVRIVLPIRNDGPGPAWALRGHINAPSAPAIDGRVIYVGAVGKGETREAELVIPLAPDAVAALRNTTIDLSVELRDAHGTAPSTPIRFRGPVIVDPTR